MNGRDGNAGLLREYDLAKQADRDVFLKGSNAQYGSTAGFAVVIGKYENKAAFLDLQPLFENGPRDVLHHGGELPEDPRRRARARSSGRTRSTSIPRGSRRSSRSSTCRGPRR